MQPPHKSTVLHPPQTISTPREFRDNFVLLDSGGLRCAPHCLSGCSRLKQLHIALCLHPGVTEAFARLVGTPNYVGNYGTFARPAALDNRGGGGVRKAPHQLLAALHGRDGVKARTMLFPPHI